MHNFERSTFEKDTLYDRAEVPLPVLPPRKADKAILPARPTHSSISSQQDDNWQSFSATPFVRAISTQPGSPSFGSFLQLVQIRSQRVPDSHRCIIDFPGMSDYKAFESEADLMFSPRCSSPHRHLYKEAESLIDRPDIFWQPMQSLSYLEKKIALTLHGLVAYRDLVLELSSRGIPFSELALTGVSAGVGTAILASEAISIADYITYFKIVTPFQEAESDRTSITVTGIRAREFCAQVRKTLPLMDVTKSTSRNQVVVYVRSSEVDAIREAAATFSPEEVTIGNFRIFQAASHTRALRGYIPEIIKRVTEANLSFRDPKVPILSSSGRGLLWRAEQMFPELLSILCEPIAGEHLADTISMLNPACVISVGRCRALKGILDQNQRTIEVKSGEHPAELASVLATVAFQSSPELRFQATDHLDLTCTEARLVEVENLLGMRAPQREAIGWSSWDLELFFNSPMDTLYSRSKRADLERIPKNIVEEIRRIAESEEQLRESVLTQFAMGHRSFRRFCIPFGNSYTEPSSPWTVFGRSISRPVQLLDGSTWSLVFKGAGTESTTGFPITIAPERIDPHSVNEFKTLPPQPSWILRGGEAYHTTRSEILNAYGIRAVYSLYGEKAKTAIPFGVFLIDQVPVLNRKTGNVDTIDTPTYFVNLYHKLPDEDKARFLRFLLIDLQDRMSKHQVELLKKAVATRELAVSGIVRQAFEH